MPFATANGINIAYRARGAGPPLVLAHGFSTASFIWEPVVDSLAARHQVIAYDQRGHGASEKPAGPYAIQTLADDLAALLNFLGLERVDLMGHSMGGRAALLFALRHGERLSRLLLVGASGAAPGVEFRARFESLKRVAAEEGMEAVFDHELYRGLAPARFQEGPPREAFRARFMKNTPEGFCGAADAILAMPDLTGRLGEIGAPTWACAGAQDAGPLAFAELCAERIPRCARAVVPGCGHYPMQDNPEGFRRALEEFLTQTPAEREGPG